MIITLTCDFQFYDFTQGAALGFLTYGSPILERVWGTEVPHQDPGSEPLVGVWLQSPRSWRNIANCTRLKSILCECVTRDVRGSIQITLFYTNLYTKCRSTNILRVYQPGVMKARSHVTKYNQGLNRIAL